MSKPTDYPASVDKSVLEQQACTTSQALLCFTDYSPYLPIPCDQRMLPVLCLNAWSAVLAPLAHGLQTAPLAPGPARPPEGHMWIGKESGMLSGSCLNKSLSRPELTQRRHENLRACRNPKVVTALQNAMGCVYIYIYLFTVLGSSWILATSCAFTLALFHTLYSCPSPLHPDSCRAPRSQGLRWWSPEHSSEESKRGDGRVYSSMGLRVSIR